MRRVEPFRARRIFTASSFVVLPWKSNVAEIVEASSGYRNGRAHAVLVQRVARDVPGAGMDRGVAVVAVLRTVVAVMVAVELDRVVAGGAGTVPFKVRARLSA